MKTRWTSHIPVALISFGLASLRLSLAEDSEQKLYHRCSTTQPGLMSLNIPEEELPAAIQRMERATYVDLAQRYVDGVKRRNHEGTMGDFQREVPSRLIGDPEEKAKAVAREQYRLAQAQVVLDLASNMTAQGITPPVRLKTEVILQSPDIYIPLDDLALAFREHCVTNMTTFSLASRSATNNAPLDGIVALYRQQREADAKRITYGKLRTIFVPLQLTFVVANREYFLAYVIATEGPVPYDAKICFAGHHLCERCNEKWQAETDSLPDPVSSGISRALPSVEFETGSHAEQYALAFNPESTLYHTVLKKHLTRASMATK